MSLFAGTSGFRLRRQTRFATSAVRCPGGRVLDMSASGMRVRIKGGADLAVGERRVFQLDAPDGRLRVTGRVVWRRRVGWFGRSRDFGVVFVDLAEGEAAALERFARRASDDPGAAGPVVQVDLPDLYAILGVAPTADASEIRAVFRDLVKTWHPDRNGSPDAAARFDQIVKAYHVLSDASLRARYDARYAPGSAA